MEITKTRIDALINLLEDDDRQVSTLAMEQLLLLEEEADDLVKELQEAPSAVLRSRIHQLGSILNIRRARSLFIDSVHGANIPLWDGIIQINYQFNPRMSFDAVENALDELVEHMPRRISTVGLASFMRDEGFSFTGEDVLGPDLYLPEDVLQQRVGAPILLSAIGKHLGERCNWHASIILHKGKHCLLDAHYNLIEPAADWSVSTLTRSDRQHPCSDREIWITVLSQLFLSALADGYLQHIHRIGTLLAKLSDGDFRDLPPPLGD